MKLPGTSSLRVRCAQRRESSLAADFFRLGSRPLTGANGASYPSYRPPEELQLRSCTLQLPLSNPGRPTKTGGLSQTTQTIYNATAMNETHETSGSLPGDDAVPFVTRIAIRNYKSIGKCDVKLGVLSMLVGRNGSGKSNFLDALRFVADALRGSLDHAIRDRGGIEAVRRRSTGHPRNFFVRLELNLPKWQIARYGFEIASKPRGGFLVKRESLRVRAANGGILAEFRREGAVVISASIEKMPPVLADRLYLVNASGLPAFRGVYDGLISMAFCNLNPEAMKELQSPDAGELLHRDGGNISSVIARLSADSSVSIQRIKDYLGNIVEGITDVNRIALGPKETLEFRQKVVGSPHPWKFYAASMSDGTLRALGTLVAVTQLAEQKERVRLVGIEEPETALHPAAAGALMDALHEAATHTQVLLTSHSPDLLDHIDAKTDQLLAVKATEGNTEIAPIDDASSKALSDSLYTAGDLLRMDQLSPNAKDLKRQEQLRLFEDDEEAS